MTDELNALAGAYVLDALTDDERTVFEEHLQSCVDCADEVRGLENAAAELSHLESSTPPPQLRTDVLAAISRVRPLPPVGSNVIPIGRSRRPRLATQLLAAACAVIAIAAGGWGLQQHNDANRAASHASALDAAISAPDAKAVTGELGPTSGITATVVYSKVHGSLVMNARGVTTLASDKTYQAWTISPNGDATSLGIFHPDQNGTVTMLAKSNLTDAAYVGVTIEPSGGSKTPTGQPLLVKL
jgi:anti-sigma-K factor RskA